MIDRIDNSDHFCDSASVRRPSMYSLQLTIRQKFVRSIGLLFMLLCSPGWFGGVFGPDVRAASSYQLLEIKPLQLGNNQNVIDLIFEGESPELNHFTMDEPPRVIIDLPGVVNQTGQRILQIDKGGVESIILGGNEGRLRLVLNLATPKKFSVQKVARGYRLSLGEDRYKLISLYKSPPKLQALLKTLRWITLK